MANIGLNNFRFAKLTEAADGTPSYDGAQKPAKAVECTVTPNNNDASLYADDGVAESDTSFSNADVTMGLDDDNSEMIAVLLGHTITEEGEMTRNANDVAPYVGLGRVIKKQVANVIKYKVEILFKVKFAEPEQSNTTQGESVEYSTPSIEGKAMSLANGDWSKTKTFDTQEAAIAYIENTFKKSA